ncbi:MAG: hypothetical protein KAR84_08640 [Elusimicrobiales bacterium]|nr:hypothetical protein [Elusimicrobiales bacterium]MCK5106409.1 hypothetical protein [Elusimicrobiales bacterium]MCK5583818.1 hypothetical protein [Elusimicrobiales bacterium]
MSVVDTISGLIDSPESFIKTHENSEFSFAGFLGYFVGTLSFFVFFRMFNLVPAGTFSFLILFATLLCGNFIFAGIIHLFLELMGKKGDILKLFFLGGVAEFFWSILIPLGFAAKLNYINSVLVLLTVFSLVIVARIIFAKYIYRLGGFKAFIAVAMPYFVLSMGGFIFAICVFAWFIWLIV